MVTLLLNDGKLKRHNLTAFATGGNGHAEEVLSPSSLVKMVRGALVYRSRITYFARFIIFVRMCCLNMI